MAIRINNTTVIDDSRNAVNIPSVTFADGTVQRTAAPVFGDTVTAGGSLLWTLDNPNAYSTRSNDNFGRSTGIYANYVIVGANENDPQGSGSGKAYIFDVRTGALVHTLNNPNAYSTSANDYFGLSVAISGNFAIVGAYGEDDVGGTSSGKAYIFDVRTGGLVWTLDNPNAYSTSAADQFGYSVAISGNYAIVGAYQEDDAGGTSSGKAYIFDVRTGELVWTLNNPNAYSTSSSDQFGYPMSMTDNYTAIGAYQEDDAGGISSGKAYIFNNVTGNLILTLNNPNSFSTSSGDNFGLGIAISDKYIAVGASSEGSAAGSPSGKVYVYDAPTGNYLYSIDNVSRFGTVTSDYFGNDLDISGNNLLISSRNDGTGNLWGTAHVFDLTTGKLKISLDNPNANNVNSYDNYAWNNASIYGNTVVVGANGETAPDGSLSSGLVYVFNIEPIRNSNYVEEIQFTNGTTLNLLADKAFQTAHPGGALVWTLDNPNAYSTSTDDYFGGEVAISGNYTIVNARQEDDVGGLSSGKAYLFNVTTGALVHTLNNPNAYSTSASDNFGVSVAISGNFAIVGAYFEDDVGGTGSGKAYIFNVTTGQLVHTLNNPNDYSTSVDDNFGRSVAISGNYAIVGASGEDDTGGTPSGKAYVFNVTTGALLWTLNNPNAYSTGTDDGFAVSVAISGNYAIVGAYQEDDVGGTESGKAYIFNVTTGALLWTLDNPNAYSTSANDFFGNSVAISDNYAIVSATGEDDILGTQSGKAYIFNVTTGQLVHTLNNPNAYGTSASDNFGQSVAISGNFAIVSTIFEDDVGGLASGKAYIFNVTTGQLLHTLNNPNVYSTSQSDFFGRSVAISENYVIVGTEREDDIGGTDSGKAYIFSTQNLTYLDKILTVAESIF